MQAVFDPVRKICFAGCPIQRALMLVEALSRDLSSQSLKVLDTRWLMLVVFGEFEEVMSRSVGVFVTWDGEHGGFQRLLRDMVWRRRDEQLRMGLRVCPARKKLQMWIEQMRWFRW